MIKTDKKLPILSVQESALFQFLYFFLINWVKGSYQDELDHYFKAIFNVDVPQRFVTKVALAKARMKLKFQAFIELNAQLTVDTRIDPKCVGERDMAAFHCLKMAPGDLVLLDRGYPAYWLFNLILAQGADFCARIQARRWKVVRKFYNSGKKNDFSPCFPSFKSSM